MRPQTILAILTLSILTLPPTLWAASLEAAPETAPSAQPEAETQGPRISLVEPVKNFGQVAQGKILQHDYEIRNLGDEVLEISQVVPACGCTVAEFDREIPPGESGEIHVEIDTSILGQRSSRDITIHSNDPTNPRAVLRFDAEVVPTLMASPSYARYMVVHGETEPGVVRHWIYAADDQDFEILDVDTKAPYLEARFRKAQEGEGDERVKANFPDRQQWLVELELKYNEAPVGALGHRVEVITDHQLQDRLIIPVSGLVRPPMWVTPHQVELGEIPSDEPITFALTVQNFLTRPMEVTGLEARGLEELEIESTIEPVQEGRKYHVFVTLDPALASGTVDGTLQVKTSNPDHPVVEVPLAGTVR